MTSRSEQAMQRELVAGRELAASQLRKIRTLQAQVAKLEKQLAKARKTIEELNVWSTSESKED